MDKIQASPRTSILGNLADLLMSGKNTANKYEILPQVPLIGGTGLGDLFLGKSPELLDDMSYNMSSAIRGGNRVTGGLGTYTLDKRSADLGMLGLDAYGLGKGVVSLGKHGLNKLLNQSGFNAAKRSFLQGKSAGLTEEVNPNVEKTISKIDEILQKPVSRRDLLKNSAIAAGVGGAIAAAPSVLRKFVKETGEVIPDVVKHSADNITNSEIKHTYDSLLKYFQDVEYHAMNMDDYPGLPTSMEDRIKYALQGDEQLYESIKAGDAYGFDDIYKQDVLNMFSPKAKQEMNALKQLNPNWHSDPEVLKQLNRGIIWSPNDDLF